MNQTNAYLTAKSSLPRYMAFPRFLMESGLNETAMLVYMLLLDRARLSMSNPRWIDVNGFVFLQYPIRELAAAIRKSEMTAKTALAVLEKRGFIQRQRCGNGKPNRIYVLIPADKNLSVPGTENRLPDGKKSVLPADRKLSANRIYRVITNQQEKGYAFRNYECGEEESL